MTGCSNPNRVAEDELNSRTSRDLGGYFVALSGLDETWLDETWLDETWLDETWLD